MAIKFVYFDVGGVVLLDFSGTNKWEELKKELGIQPDQNGQFEKFWKKYESEICISRQVDSLVPLIQEEFHVSLPHNYSLLINGFVNRFEKNQSIWPVIKKISNLVPVGLLTNMYPGMLSAINSKALLPMINWNVVIDSSEVGFEKPDPEIYEYAEKKAGATGNEIIFIENSLGHLSAAKLYGWQTYLYDSSKPDTSSQNLLKQFNKLIQLP